MVYVYRRALSTGAKELADALGGRRFRGRVRPITQQVKAGDVVVCWGEMLAPIPGVRILNGGAIKNKYEDAIAFKIAGVPTIEVSRARVAPIAPVVADAKVEWEEAIEAAEEFIEVPYSRDNPAFIQGISELAAVVVKLKDKLAAKVAAVVVTWLGRMNDHVGGLDLLNPPAAPDFWVKKETITEEIRIHSFNEKSIKAGKKVPRAGMQQHAWVRSYDGGWRINYDGFESRKAQRELAHKAVKALGLQFGAVDLGKKADGTWIVLEVNRACGMEDGTVESYKTAIQSWIQQIP